MWSKKPLRAAVAGAIFFLILGSPVAAQFRAMPAPSTYGNQSTDLFPFLVGVCVFLSLFIVLFTLVVLPALARACKLKPMEDGARVGVAIPASIVVLWLAWKPLHLTNVSVWVTVAALIALVVAVLVVLGAAAWKHVFESLFIGGVAVGTLILNMKTTWGFWLSLLAAVGGTIATLLVGAGICDVAIFAAKKVRKENSQ